MICVPWHHICSISLLPRQAARDAGAAQARQIHSHKRGLFPRWGLRIRYLMVRHQYRYIYRCMYILYIYIEYVLDPHDWRISMIHPTYHEPTTLCGSWQPGLRFGKRKGGASNTTAMGDPYSNRPSHLTATLESSHLYKHHGSWGIDILKRRPCTATVNNLEPHLHAWSAKTSLLEAAEMHKARTFLDGRVFVEGDWKKEAALCADIDQGRDTWWYIHR